jgi:hypothetical protein
LGLFVRHNNRDESYLVPEELVSHIAIFLSCPVLLFYLILQQCKNYIYFEYILVEGGERFFLVIFTKSIQAVITGDYLQ